MLNEKTPGGHQGEYLTDPVRTQGNDGSETAPRQALRQRLITQTIPYLMVLLNCTEDEAWTTEVTTQVFDDGPAKKKERAAIIHGCLDDLAENLDRRNIEGDGIFIAPNATNLRGRTKKDVTHLRAVWADLDEKDANRPFDPAELPLPPTMAVRSGHGTHLYWCFPEPVPCLDGHQETAEALLRGIREVLKDFGADAQVCQVAGVLRLPGFYNVKREPVLVEVLR